MALPLLWGHVGDRSNNLLLDRALLAGLAFLIGQVGNAKVAKHNFGTRKIRIATEHQVCRFEVSVHNATGVGRFEGR